MEASLRLLRQQVASQEEVLLKTAAPNLRALENLKTVRDKFQESTDGELGGTCQQGRTPGGRGFCLFIFNLDLSLSSHINVYF